MVPCLPQRPPRSISPRLRHARGEFPAAGAACFQQPTCSGSLLSATPTREDPDGLLNRLNGSNRLSLSCNGANCASSSPPLVQQFAHWPLPARPSLLVRSPVTCASVHDAPPVAARVSLTRVLCMLLGCNRAAAFQCNSDYYGCVTAAYSSLAHASAGKVRVCRCTSCTFFISRICPRLYSASWTHMLQNPLPLMKLSLATGHMRVQCGVDALPASGRRRPVFERGVSRL